MVVWVGKDLPESTDEEAVADQSPELEKREIHVRGLIPLCPRSEQSSVAFDTGVPSCMGIHGGYSPLHVAAQSGVDGRVCLSGCRDMGKW